MPSLFKTADFTNIDLHKMKTHIIPALKLTLVLLVLLAVVYPAVVWGVAKLSPDGGNGERITYKGKTYYKNIGQSFTADDYFWSRPSAVGYNAAGSGGSNKGASNAEYLNEVKTRIATLLSHNPGLKTADIPMDLITASGSGLDPDISVQAANIQVNRIAAIRKLPVDRLLTLVKDNTQKPALGLFGPEKINVLMLNLALDQLAGQ